jgi:hypothetical protein
MVNIASSKRWLLQAAAAQTFLTLVSLPILVAWGLPLSYLTPVGTLLFTPILTAYLWCALAVFFTALCAIPNSYCIAALQYVSDWWLWILGLIKTPWQIGFVCPPIGVLIFIPVSAFALVWYLRMRSLAMITGSLLLLLFGWILFLRALPQQKKITVEHDNGKQITAFNTNNCITIVDSSSCCSSMVDGSNWIAYHALPTITMQTGASHIDQFIVLHPRQRTFEALTALIEKGMIHDVQIPYWHGHIPFNAWCAYKTLQKTITAYGYNFMRFGHKSTPLNNEHRIIADAHTCNYGDATYPSYTLQINQEAKELNG